MPKVTKIPIVFFLVLVCISSASFGAKFFKWTDEDGNIHYSDKEPVKQEAEAVHVNAPKASKSAQPPPKLTIEENEDPSPEELAAKEEEEEQLLEYCKGVQSSIKTMEKASPVRIVDNEGKSKFLDKEERAEKLETYRQQYSERCNF